jgi:hypothetical protein
MPINQGGSTMTRLAFAAFAVGLLISGGAMAATETFHATLTGDMQVPPVTTSATGSATVVVDTDAKTVTYTVTYTGLTPIMAHIHGPAGIGKNAAVIIPFKIGPSPFTGTAPATDAQIKMIEDGDAYVNVHTADHKAGEIRGQLTK